MKQALKLVAVFLIVFFAFAFWNEHQLENRYKSYRLTDQQRLDLERQVQKEKSAGIKYPVDLERSPSSEIK